jgi:hypothetical protein
MQVKADSFVWEGFSMKRAIVLGIFGSMSLVFTAGCAGGDFGLGDFGTLNAAQEDLPGEFDDGQSNGNDNDGEWDRDDCKIEDENLGRTDLTLTLAGVQVTVSNWVEKDDSPGEYIGFTLDGVGDDFGYTVKAGTDRYDGEGANWDHPNGTTGPQVHAISHIDFCDNCVPGEPCGAGGGDDTGGGDDPNGGGDDEGGDDDDDNDFECEECGTGNGGDGNTDGNEGLTGDDADGSGSDSDDGSDSSDGLTGDDADGSGGGSDGSDPGDPYDDPELGQ